MILSMVLGEESETLSTMAPILYLLAFWATIAINVKRWHDRNKSGWWMLIYIIPMIGPLWFFIELGFLPGTDAANRFGPVPGRRNRETLQSLV